MLAETIMCYIINIDEEVKFFCEIEKNLTLDIFGSEAVIQKLLLMP